MKNILIVDPNPVSRRALGILLKNRISEVEIIETDDIQLMMDRINANESDVILLDEALFEQPGQLSAVNLILSKCNIILLSVDKNKIELANLIGAGFIHKGIPPDGLVEFINSFECRNQKRER